jgi:hypothetical protein
VNSLKQQSAGIHVVDTHGYIILFAIQHVSALIRYCHEIRQEPANTNCIVFRLIQQGIEPMIRMTC